MAALRGSPYVRFRCRPTAPCNPLSETLAQACSNAGMLAMSVVDDTQPCWKASNITSLTSTLNPKSSALTITRAGFTYVLSHEGFDPTPETIGGAQQGTAGPK